MGDVGITGAWDQRQRGLDYIQRIYVTFGCCITLSRTQRKKQKRGIETKGKCPTSLRRKRKELCIRLYNTVMGGPFFYLSLSCFSLLLSFVWFRVLLRCLHFFLECWQEARLGRAHTTWTTWTTWQSPPSRVPERVSLLYKQPKLLETNFDIVLRRLDSGTIQRLFRVVYLYILESKLLASRGVCLIKKLTLTNENETPKFQWISGMICATT